MGSLSQSTLSSLRISEAQSSKWNHKIEVELSKENVENNLWKAVREHTGTKASDPLLSLLGQFGSVHEAVEHINNICQQCMHQEVEQVTPLIMCKTKAQDIGYLISHLTMSSNVLTVFQWVSHPQIFLQDYIKKLDFCWLNLYRYYFNTQLMKWLYPKYGTKTSVSTSVLSPVYPLPNTNRPIVSDIRPISLISFPMKIFEKLVLISLKSLFVRHFGK